MSLAVGRKTARIVELTGHVDFLSAVRHIQISISSCIITTIVGLNGSQYRLHFPAPVSRPHSNSRIAGTSPYAEVLAPIASPTNVEKFPHFMYPLFINANDPVIWNMPRLNL
jgi:hypothetical protein